MGGYTKRMEPGAGLVIFLKALALALVVNVAAHAALDAWSSYFAAIVASVVIAVGVWLGQRLRVARR